MKRSKPIQIIVVIFFVLLLALPILKINIKEGTVSLNESRVLASFPKLLTDDGSWNPDLKTEFETWINDNIGFRDLFLDIATTIKVKFFNQSSSDSVHIGLDGWLYYTENENLDIAKGTYTLTQEDLEVIAEQQQMLANYYESIGVEYVLVLTPSKVSVYPEFIGDSDYEITETPCDIVEAYLKEHTTVNVINVKQANIAQKEEHQQFIKIDTHWTEAGVYTAYHEIIEKLNEFGIVSSSPVSVEYGTVDIPSGDLTRMLGSPKVMGTEVSSDVRWEQSAVEIQEGEWYEQLEDVRIKAKNSYPIQLFSNEDQEGTVLVYRDSQWEKNRNMPQLLAEHFGNVVTARIRSYNEELEDIANPDVVIFGCSERLINSILTKETSVPNIYNQLPNIPEQPHQTADYWIGSNGMYLDRYNNNKPETQNVISIDFNAEEVELIGWAADFKTMQPLSDLYVQVGDKVIKCEYGIERTGVATHFETDDLTNTGFTVTFPTSYLEGGQIDHLQFIQIASDGSYRYESVIYKLS